jgi:hypothetical protein
MWGYMSASCPNADQVRALGGTALCDWVDNIAKASALEQPSVLVIEFVGNNLSRAWMATPRPIRSRRSTKPTPPS